MPDSISAYHPVISGFGLSPSAIAKLSHQTPYLLMDLASVTKTHHGLTHSLPNVQIHYAMKCNPHPRLLQHLHQLGSRFEIASYTELELLIDQGVNPADVLYSNPVKPAEHIAAAAQAGVWRFAFDSLAELEKISRHAPGASVYVRLQVQHVHSEVASEGKFGVTASTATQLLLQAKEHSLTPYGIAFHVGSQMLRPEAWDQAIHQSGQIMRELQTVGVTLHLLDLGGGFPARYADAQPQLANFGAPILAAIARHLPYPVELAIEPGRALVAEAGVMVATIIGVAQRGTKRWLHLDVGAFNGMMESLETRNQMIYPLADELGLEPTQAYNLTGPSCDSQDTLLYDYPLSPGLVDGQKVLIYTAGAYTTSYASTFNGFSLPTTHYTTTA